MKNLIILALLVGLGYMYFKNSKTEQFATANITDSMLSVVDSNELVKKTQYHLSDKYVELKRELVEHTDADVLNDLVINKKPNYDINDFPNFTANTIDSLDIIFLKIKANTYVVMEVSPDRNKLLLKHVWDMYKVNGRWVTKNQGDGKHDLYTYDIDSKNLVLQFHNNESIYNPKFNATMDSITCIRGQKNPDGIGTSDLPFALKIKE